MKDKEELQKLLAFAAFEKYMKGRPPTVAHKQFVPEAIALIGKELYLERVQEEEKEKFLVTKDWKEKFLDAYKKREKQIAPHQFQDDANIGHEIPVLQVCKFALNFKKITEVSIMTLNKTKIARTIKVAGIVLNGLLCLCTVPSRWQIVVNGFSQHPCACCGVDSGRMDGSSGRHTFAYVVVSTVA